jgi:hypothetical protein
MNPFQPPQALTPGPMQPRPVSSLDAVRFVFTDPEWKTNVLLGLVMLLIPIVGPLALNGWLCEIHQRLVRRHPHPVPRFDFSDFGHYMGRGVSPFVVGLVVMLPLGMFVYIGMFVVAFGAIGVAEASREPAMGLVFGIVGGLALLAVMLVSAVLMNAAQTRAELTESIGDALRPGDLFDFGRRTWGKVMLKSISFGFISTGIVLLGLLLCYFGLYPAIVVIQIGALHLRYQLYEAYLAAGGAPISVKAPQALPSEARYAAPGFGG